MFTRILSSAAAGLTMTAGLLYLMHYLIDISEGAVDPRPPIRIEPWGRTIDDSDLIVDELPPERVDSPLQPPPLRPRVDPHENLTVVGIPKMVTPPSGPANHLTELGMVDGALMTIVNVRPNYPTAASQKGIEGHVIVQFDVTAMGTVTNARVLESSNRLFNNAALNAAKKFRFKPKIVNGQAEMSFGVQRLFTFEMEQD